MRTKPWGRALAGALMVATVLVAASTPAHAWYQPLGQELSFYAPGPPPGPYQGACIVKTKIWKDWSGDRASISTERHGFSQCRDSLTNSVVTIVTLGPLGLDETGGATGNLYRKAEAQGAPGEPVFGAHWTAYNDYAALYWDTVVV